MTECETPLCNSINDDEQQLIKLCLKKPQKWNWELSTSKSSSNIQFPTIQLFDEDNKTLLAETNEANFVAGSKKLRKSASVSKASSMSKRSVAVETKERNLRDTKSPISIETVAETAASSKRDPNLSAIDDVDSSKRDERRQPKIYSRSSSCRSRSSILKRIREFSELNQESSDEEQEAALTGESSDRRRRSISNHKEAADKKKYSMRTCNVGTILVPKESFSKVSRRRRRGSDSNALDNVTTVFSGSNNSGSKNNSGNSYLPRIIDVQDINKIGIELEAQKYLKDVSTHHQNPSSDEVFLLLVKRLASLHCNNSNLQQSHDNLKSFSSQQKAAITNSNSHCRERERNTDRKSIGEHDRKKKLEATAADDKDQHYINDTITISNRKSTRTEEEQQRMGSNVSSAGKGLSGRRTQSQSNIDNKSSSITNGICCSTKYSKSKRKNSSLSQQDFDKKPFNNNNAEHFDGVSQIIAANSTHVVAAKPKKSNQGKGKEKEKDKKKLHGSLPNHLDTDVDYEGSDDTNSSTYGNRVKFDPINKILTPNSPTHHQQQHQQQLQQQQHHHQQQQQQQQLQVINDQCYDQGYGSERSPEDEMLPPLPQITSAEQYNSMVINAMPQGLLLPNTNQLFDVEYQQKIQQQQSIQYDFITEDCTFNVEIVKGLGGLGLSVAGGSDSSDAYPGLIRIKRLFPHQAAWMTGLLQTGDILLEANGIILTGLTNNEALEVLRTMANVVNLLVCRPHDENFRKLLATNVEAPVPPLRSSFNFKHQQYMNQFELAPGEFEITLVKHQGSLGFTLQKEDEAFTGHYVRALVREPATTDGRIQAGDKIIAVNDIPISNMTHEQAVIFLRQASDTVKLRLYRHDGTTDQSGTLKRSKLRPEAMSFISDLAIKKNTQSSSDGNSDNSSFQSSTNTMSSPRRLRKNNVKCSITSASLDSSSGGGSSSNNNSTLTANNLCDSPSNISSFNSNSNQTMAYIVSDGAGCGGGNGTGTSSGTHTPFSDSSADTMTIVSQRIKSYYDPHELPADDDDTNDGFYDSDELESLVHDNECANNDDERMRRPETLNLQCGQTDSGSTPQAARKPMYRFSIATANAYELNNLDAVLDAPTSFRMGGDDLDGSHDDTDGHEHSFTSLPCETLLLACKTENDLKNSPSNDIDTCLYVTKFGKNQPLYQSAQVQINHRSQSQHHQQNDASGEKNLLKWKGVTMLSPPPPSPPPPAAGPMAPQQSTMNEIDDNDDDKCSIISSSEQGMPMASLRVSVRNAQKDINLDEMGIDSNTYKIITIEMNRRWSCRMGIRLESQVAPNSNGTSGSSSGKSITVIKEICKDTLAAKDGRLRAGDRVLMINDEIVDARSTQEIIDMMRIIRGPLCITIARRNDS